MRSKHGWQRYKPASTRGTMNACMQANCVGLCRITNCIIPDSIQFYALLDNVYVDYALQG